MKRVLLVLAAATASAVVFIGCNDGGNCSPANCGGCCTAQGQCVTGNTTAECGRQGADCSACATGQSCATNVCAAAMGGGGGAGGGGGGVTGGGGGTTGGGSGGGTTGGGSGGGGQVTCATFDFTTGATDLGAGYEPETTELPAYNWGVLGKPSATANRFDFLGVELWYGTPPVTTFPYAVNLNGTDYSTCEGCLLLSEACDAMGQNCERVYLGQQGTMTFTAATQNPNAGTFAGNGAAINATEWLISNTQDEAAPNARCAVVSYSLSSSWDAGQPDAGQADAGVDAGLVDAGVDAGTMDAGTDAGLLDAGELLDAGLDAGLELDAGLDSGVQP